MNVQYAVLGGLRTDYVITAEGETFLGEHGGNAIYAAAGMRLWSESVGIVGRVGSNFPESWLTDAKTAGLDLSGVRRLPTWQETRTFFAYLPDGRRDDTDPAGHFASRGLPMPPELEGYTSSTLDFDSLQPNPLTLTPDDLPPFYRQANGIHVAPYDLRTHLDVLPALVELETPVVTLDPNYGYSCPEHAEHIHSLLPHVDAFLPSELEVIRLLGHISPAEAARHFVRNGARLVVVKLGEHGSLVLDTEGRTLWHVPAYPAQVQDLTGAGDAFCGGFLVGYVESGNPVRAAMVGTVSASFVIESRGGLAAIRHTRCEAEERLQWLLTHRPPQPA
jgi:ribokinase